MGCFWGKRDNNSYADTTITASDGTSYKYGTVFTEKTTKGEGIACSSYANCYIGCSCNTSNGWYSTCQGSDCKSATDNHYTGVNSLSAGKSISDVTSISASGAAKSGLKTASAGKYTSSAAGTNSGISTMASGATTCYKKKTCSEGGYYDSVPTDQKCSSKSYNGYSCYTGCSYKTCSDYGYESSIPLGQKCSTVYPRSGLTCYKDCKDEVEDKYFQINVIKKFDSSCPTNFASAFNGISGCTIGGKSCDVHTNEYTISKVESGTRFIWKPNQSYSNASATATTSDAYDTIVYVGGTFRVTYHCSNTGDESVKVDYYTESRQEYSSAIGQNDNNLYLVIKSDRPADKNYTVVHDGYARYNGGYIPGSYADSHDGACEGSMMNSHSCTLKQGKTKVECLLYECPCKNLWWDGTLSPSW